MSQMESLTIRDVIEQVESGQIRIPAFQRGFVWEPERVAHFMDSLYKGYPYGALLFWRASEKLKVERKLGPFELPDPRADYPIDYVLDGQQRVTSIYATFQVSRQGQDDEWKDIYFDFTLPDDMQEPQFFAPDEAEVDPKRYFPLRALFDTGTYRKATRAFEDSLANKIDAMQSRFKELRIPVQIFKTEDKGRVAVIFERINRMGVALDTLQLLSAWTWSEDFQLQGQFEELINEIEAKGFNASSFDENLLLRCASAILVTNPRPDAIVKIPGEQVRKRFDEVLNGVLGALDFLQSNLGLRRIDNLPFQTIMVPLSVFFAVSGTKGVVLNQRQRERLLKWFWRVCFARRYSSGVIRHLQDDLKSMLQLKGGQESSLGEFAVSISEQFFLRNSFGIGNVNSKSFVLMLAQQKPLSFVSGTPIDLDEKLKEYNRTEFHHIMPRAYLRSIANLKYSSNCLANICFLSQAENKHLGGVRPSEYKQRMATNHAEILRGALCPTRLFSDEFDVFVEERSALLASAAKILV